MCGPRALLKTKNLTRSNIWNSPLWKLPKWRLCLSSTFRHPSMTWAVNFPPLQPNSNLKDENRSTKAEDDFAEYNPSVPAVLPHLLNFIASTLVRFPVISRLITDRARLAALETCSSRISLHRLHAGWFPRIFSSLFFDYESPLASPRIRVDSNCPTESC